MDTNPSILQPSAGSLLSSAPAPAPAAPAERRRSFTDPLAARRAIYDDVLQAATNLPPVSDGRFRLQLRDPEYIDPDTVSKRDQKQDILTGATRGRRLRGTWDLVDEASGQVLESRRQIIARVPHFTERGTFIHNGVEQTLRNQQRLVPGVFARIRNNGELESHINVLPGEGVTHKYLIDPKKGVFQLKIQQATVPLMPLLRAAGATDAQLREAWGRDVLAANAVKNEPAHLRKLAERVLSRADRENLHEGDIPGKLVAAFAKMRLDPEATRLTLGKPYERLDLEAMLSATKKLLAVHRGEAEPDDRDAPHFQSFLGPEDLLSERLAKDHGRLRQRLLRKIVASGGLAKMPTGALTSQLEHALLRSGLGVQLEETNPLEILDRQTSLTRLGEGGIPSTDAVPDEARSVQPTQTGFVDLVRTVESMRVGIDNYLSHRAVKGQNGRIYAPFIDARTGKEVPKSPRDLADATLAFPEVMQWPTKRVPVLRGGKLNYAPRDQIDLFVPPFEGTFSPLGAMVPFKSAAKNQRTAMAARMFTQALPLVGGEAPLVRGEMPGRSGRSFFEEYAPFAGAVNAQKPGEVESIKDGTMHVRYDDGTRDAIEMYQTFPFNRRTFLHQTPLVEPGTRFGKDQPLIRSNFTDNKGAVALGLNARTAYWPYLGYNFEDAVVVSESFAKRANSEHLYQHQVDVDDQTRLGKKAYQGLFASRFDKKTLDKLDQRGLAQVGQEVHYGDPLILAARERPYSATKVHRKRQTGFTDQTVVWDHKSPGVVTDVVESKDGPVVVVKTHAQLQVGDKLSGLYGDKGVVSHIVPDEKMPHGADKKPYEVLLSPTGITSRGNPAQEVEAALGKLAQQQGKPITVPDFDKIEDLSAWAKQKLQEAGLASMESLYWPERGRHMPPVATGMRWFMKLHHMAEDKEQARDSGGYTADETPAKGGASGSKRLSMLDVNALVAHGAVDVLRDNLVRGHVSDDWWLAFLRGHTPRDPRSSHTWDKFVSQLQGSGIRVKQEGGRFNVMALTQPDVEQLAGDRSLRNGDTIDVVKGRSVPGGLFDPQLTGGPTGRRWSKIDLYEPMLNPVMEEPARRILGLTKKGLEGVIAGTQELAGYGSGPKALATALDRINLPQEIAKAKALVHTGRQTVRDDARRRLGYLLGAQERELHPRDWMLKSAPVLPPIFRPVSQMRGGMPLVADANLLYKELLDANDNLKDLHKHLGDAGVGQERLAVYNAFKAVTGLADPLHPKLQEKGVRGFLKHVLGTNPKFGTLQRKLLSGTMDQVGRAVITPNPDFDMDTIGVPEDAAFESYKRFVVRRLHRQGLPIVQALRHVIDKTDLARDALQEEMEHRPVIATRAPVLHKFGIMAFRPQLVDGNTLQVSPLIVKGFNADFDGDTMTYHVPASEGARRQALEKMLPSHNLLSPADFKTPVHTLGQEYLAGLYAASRAPDKKKRPRVFATVKDMLSAYERGDLDPRDPVEVIDH